MNPVIKDFIKVSFIPMVVNKFFIIYFGLKYSERPGVGYGYGLAATIVILVFMIGTFLWKYKDVEDP